jgi:amino acid transporter
VTWSLLLLISWQQDGSAPGGWRDFLFCGGNLLGKGQAASVGRVSSTETPPASAPPPRARQTLRHNYLSFLENTAQTLGVMAPTGTLGIILPLLIAKAGNATWISFLLTLIAFSLIMYCIQRFARHCASAGALAAYADAGLGRSVGIVAGWAYVIAMGVGVASAAPSSAYYANVFLTQITGIPGTFLRGAVLTTVVIGVAWLVAHRDIKLSTKIMLAIEFSSLAVMLLIIGLAMFHSNAWIDRPQLRLEGAKISGFQFAMVFGFMTLAGFESVTSLGEEARHATRTIPRVIVSCLIPIGLLYLVAIYCLVALGRKNGLALDQLDAPFDAIARRMGWGALGYFSSVGIALSYFACTLGSLNAGARVLYSMAQKREFAPRYGVAHPVNATPSRAIALLSLTGIAAPVTLLFLKVSLVDCVNDLTQLASFGFIGAYFFVCLALPFFLRRRGILRMADKVISGGALLILSAVLGFSVFPVPPAPLLYLPYVFLAMMALGIGMSFVYLRRGRTGEERPGGSDAWRA